MFGSLGLILGSLEGVCLLASSVFDKEKWAVLASRTKMHCFQSKPKKKKGGGVVRRGGE